MGSRRAVGPRGRAAERTDIDCQPFPVAGRLADHLNLSLDGLRQKIGAASATVYSYVVATVQNPDGSFRQTGSAPNFQGDVITLCTCKHLMRTFLDVRAWPGTWVAGFCGVGAGDGRNALVYLMQVGEAFESRRDLWFGDALSGAARETKNAHLNRLGDVYPPRPEMGDKFDHRHYLPPADGHVHAKVWHNDIDYGKRRVQPPALLVGDPEFSFLWSSPRLFHVDRLHRGQRKDDLQSLLLMLEE